MKLSKSYGEYVLGLYAAMFDDIAEYYPVLRVECMRDYKRLLSAVEQHGPRFLFETLPAFGKHFDLCLSNGRLIKSGLCHFGPYRHDTPIPRLFKGLLLRVFDEQGVLRRDPDVNCIRYVRQLAMAVKRFRISCPESFTWEHVHDFFRIDSEVNRGSLNWDYGDFSLDGIGDLQLGDYLHLRPDDGPLFEGGDRSTVSTSSLADCLSTIQSVADLACAEIGRFNPLEWRPRHGPGAVSDLRKDHFKYDFPHWPEKLERMFPMADFSFANFDHWAQFVQSEGDRLGSRSPHEPPSRLIAVPKTFAGPRLIASEPTSHQWCQQIVRDFLMSRVEHTSLRYSISFRDQTPNQVLACAASRDGTHSTIDLSSASDRISCFLVERIFRRVPSIVDAFYSVRTRWITQDIDRNSPRFHRLRKFSTMGSALTFPVQTIVFTVVAIGTYLYEKRLPVNSRTVREASKVVRVFGDDIIVPIDSHGSTVELLTLLGLKVNPAKTFSTGKFRESCGYDGYDGHNVTKVSVMSAPSLPKPESILSSVDVHNNFYIRGWYKTAAYVKSTVARIKNYAFMNVPVGSGALGWYDDYYLGNSHLQCRWNPRLQRLEYRTSVPKGAARRFPVESNSTLLQYFTEAAGRPSDKIRERLGRIESQAPLKLRWSWAPEAR